MSRVLEVKNLNFSYHKERVLKDISFGIDKGDFLAVIGPNGGGKSTLLKLILGLLKPTSGEIKLFGKDSKEVLEDIGYVPQNTNINIDFPIKVIEVVLMGHIYKKRPLFKIGYDKFEIACAMESLKKVGMDRYANRKIGSLSGGQRQRVMIARAICAHPKILILDEPTANIDSKGQREIYDLLKLLNKNLTILVVSHDITLILGYANKVIYINRDLTYHDISNSQLKKGDEHFCEVEMLEMLNRSKDA
jgi:zinc transport system ATP-binding protein